MHSNTFLSSIIRYGTGLVFVAVVAILLAARFSIPGGYQLYSVLSGSMEPFIPVGSLVIAQSPRSATDIQPGTIITFEQPGNTDTLITHRVAAVAEKDAAPVITTKGDANNTADSRPITLRSVHGVYKTHIPTLGRFLEYVKSPPGVLVFVLFPLLILIADELRRIVKTLSRLAPTPAAPMQLARHPVPAQLPKMPVVDSVLAQKNLPVQHRKRKVKVTALVIYLASIASVSSIFSSYALLTSNTASVTGNSITIADIVPSPTPEPTVPSDPCGVDADIDQSNSNTGPGSINENSTEIAVDCDITKETTTDIANDIDIEANTGGNESSGNTNAGDQSSGDINIDIGITNTP